MKEGYRVLYIFMGINAELLHLKLIQLFAKAMSLLKKLEIEETKNKLLKLIQSNWAYFF